ncbi:unnamed protein product [marine sediment metagenome]|uniref:Uncharacterized protein n=1 Tax=marine sediment metagenome TaxID=412755 RepID=X1NH82_9ZZZZ
MAPNGQMKRQKGLDVVTDQTKKKIKIKIFKPKSQPINSRREGCKINQGIPASIVPAGQSLQNHGSRRKYGIITTSVNIIT